MTTAIVLERVELATAAGISKEASRPTPRTPGLPNCSMPSNSPQRQLTTYRAKRDFSKTAEPSGASSEETGGYSYVVQKHAATRLHYDLRLELGGVLKSWAVTKGPSLNPEDKRLAVHVEDHPLEYGSFEGTIPQGQYGGGTVMLWDEGSWEPIGNPVRSLAKGNLTFTLSGKRLKGRWHLVRMRRRPSDGKRENWLLIKGKDEYADSNGASAVEKYTESVASRRTMEGIARGKGQAWTRRGPKEKAIEETEDAVAALKEKQARVARRTATPKRPASKRGPALTGALTLTKARQVRRAKATSPGNVVAGITITHPDRVLRPESNITKLVLAQYMRQLRHVCFRRPDGVQ